MSFSKKKKLKNSKRNKKSRTEKNLLHRLFGGFGRPNIMKIKYSDSDNPKIKAEKARMAAEREEFRAQIAASRAADREKLRAQKTPQDLEEDTLCVICQEIMKNDELITKLECTHSFHTECLKDWLARNNNICPLCRGTSTDLPTLLQLGETVEKEQTAAAEQWVADARAALATTAVADDDDDDYDDYDQLRDINWYWRRRAMKPVSELWLYADMRAHLARAEAERLKANAITETSDELRERARQRAARQRANEVFWKDAAAADARAAVARVEGSWSAVATVTELKPMRRKAVMAAAKAAAKTEENSIKDDDNPHIEELRTNARAEAMRLGFARAAAEEEEEEANAEAARAAAERESESEGGGQRPRSRRQKQRSRREGRQRGMRQGSGKRRWMR